MLLKYYGQLDELTLNGRIIAQIRLIEQLSNFLAGRLIW